MVNRKLAVAVYLIGCTVCTIGGVISGHAVCMHQHVSSSEHNKMLRDSKGNLNTWTYCANIVRDYINMQKDPLGLETGLK